MSPVALVAALLVVAIGACIQGSLGFGLGLIGAPVLALIDEDFVPGPLLFIGVVLTAIVAARERGALDWRGIRWALVGRVFGTAIGTIAITRVSEDGLVALLAVSILVAVALSVAGWHVRPTPTTLVGAGTVSGVMGMLPGIGKIKQQLAQANIDETILKRQEAIIGSMTKEERKNPKLIHASRKKRIAAGSGTSVQDVNKLLKQHMQMADMMKRMSKLGQKGFMRSMGAMLPGMPGMPKL